MPTIMSTPTKVLIIEERDLLREKIAGIISREETVSMVTQVSSYSELQTALEETVPDLVLGDLLELKKFCESTGFSVDELCPYAKLLLYTDEYRQLHRIELGHLSHQKIFDMRSIQQEVRSFLQVAKGKKRVDKVVYRVSKKVDRAKDKISKAKKDAADIANDISKSVKKAVR